MPACLYNTIFSTLALHRIENRNFELFGSLKAERGHWSSSLDSLHCNRWNFQNRGQVVLSEPLQSGIFPWNGTVLKDAQELFLIPSIKPLPTCFLFIKTPSISSPNVWVLTHLNTWKPSCLLTKRKQLPVESEMSARRTEENSGLLGSQWPPWIRNFSG